MRPLANNPYCVWFDCKMRTFKTLAGARNFARQHGGRIGAWSNDENWWIEDLDLAAPDDTQEPEPVNMDGAYPPTPGHDDDCCCSLCGG